MIEINKNFFRECREKNNSSGETFFEIKRWGSDNIKRIDEMEYQRVLSFHIIGPGREQLNLNRKRKSNIGFDGGVEIPIGIAPHVGKIMIAQTMGNPYIKGECDIRDVGKYFGYTFERIQGFPVGPNVAINFKLMYNDKETKYFVNKQKGVKGDQPGVEIPIQMLEQVGRYLIECSKMCKSNNHRKRE